MMADSSPTARYDRHGDLYLDIGSDLANLTRTHIFWEVLRQHIPVECCDAEFYGAGPDTVWVEWRYGPRAEAIAKLFWPNLRVVARANPHYESRDEWREVPSFGQRAAEIAGRR